MKRALFILLFIIIAFAMNAQVLNLGILTDFERSSELDSIFQLVMDEIERTTGPANVVILDSENGISYGINTFEDARREYQLLTQTSDLVIILGSISVKGCVDLASFPIPTIGLGIIDPHLQDLPYENGTLRPDGFAINYAWLVFAEKAHRPSHQPSTKKPVSSVERETFIAFKASSR